MKFESFSYSSEVPKNSHESRQESKRARFVRENISFRLAIENLGFDPPEEKISEWMTDHEEEIGLLFDHALNENPNLLEKYEDDPDEVIAKIRNKFRRTRRAA